MSENTPTPRDCKHGQLARSCRYCELEIDNEAQRIAIAGLHADLAAAREKLQQVEDALELTKLGEQIANLNADKGATAFLRELARAKKAEAELAQAREELARAEAKREAAVKDAERINWLEQHDGRYYNIDRVSAIVGDGFLVNMGAFKSKSLRAAIDAAMKGER